MEVNELEKKLSDAEVRLEKANNLLSKYQIKLSSVNDKVKEAESKGYRLNDNGYTAANWSTIPSDVYELFYSQHNLEDLIKSTTSNIKELTRIRDNWKTKLEVQKAKDSELNTIPTVIKEYIHNWRIKVEKFVSEELDNYIKERKSLYDNYGSKYWDYSYTPEERKEANKIYNERIKELELSISPLTAHLYSRCRSNYKDELTNILNKEERDKALDLVNRVAKITGPITDASNLRIGEQNGELNGLIIGRDGKAFIQTIGAGGYNIQCYHYRVLVHKVKEN